MTINKSDITSILSKINDPQSGKNIIDANKVEHIQITDRIVRVILNSEEQEIALACQSALENLLPKEKKIRVVLTKHLPQSRSAAAAGAGVPRPQKGTLPPALQPSDKKVAPSVIAVASGKGGVGKSTVAVHLALAFGRMGLRCGLMDADIYGPSTPTMLGIQDKPKLKDKNIVPIRVKNITFISLGLMVSADRALVWRGPMVHSAVSQMIDNVHWGQLDIMVIDMPPGTGDAQLSLAQKKILTGAILVSTPQKVALNDVIRALSMFQTTQVPLLGVIENMAYFEDDQKKRNYIFGQEGGRKLAQQYDIPFLGDIPLDPVLGEACDKGQAGSVRQDVFDAIAEKLKPAIVAAAHAAESK